MYKMNIYIYMITKVQIINKSPHIITSFMMIGASEFYSLRKQSAVIYQYCYCTSFLGL